MINSVDVIVKMHATQSMGDQKDGQKRECAGKRYERDGIFTVKYRDAESGTVDTMEITPRRIGLRRSGSINASMEFAPGEAHLFKMDTELGELEFLVRTTRVAVGVHEERVTVVLAYDLYADGALVSHNHVDYEICDQSDE